VKGKNESEALKSLLEEFLGKKHVKETLILIGKKNITGCEKWFQIELMKFLYDHQYITDNGIGKEEYFLLDQRKDKNRKGIRLDISFRPKNKQYYIAIELKHCSYLCWSLLNSELAKLQKIKPTLQGYYRLCFALLIHRKSFSIIRFNFNI